MFKKQSFKTALASNPPIKKFGLIPITDSLPLKELLKIILIGSKKTIPSGTNLSAISKSLDVGFIVLTRVTYTPIEYNIRPIIIKSVAEKYIQPDTFGPTAKSVDRFKTIRAADHQKKWTYDTTVHNPKAETFYVVETLDNELYRCLHNQLNSTIYSLHSIAVQPLIEYSKNPTAPTRAANYNNVAIKKSIPVMFLNRQRDLDSYPEIAESVPIHLVKQKISTECNKLVDQIIQKDFRGNIKSTADINVLIHDTRLSDLFYKIVLASYKTTVSVDDLQKHSAGDFSFSELLSTFMASIDISTGKFMKELHDSYGRIPLDAKVFNMPTDQRMDVIRSRISDVIEAAINLTLKHDANVYSELYLKYMLLNFF
jgi:hypothetical protein